MYISQKLKNKQKGIVQQKINYNDAEEIFLSCLENKSEVKEEDTNKEVDYIIKSAIQLRCSVDNIPVELIDKVSIDSLNEALDNLKDLYHIETTTGIRSDDKSLNKNIAYKAITNNNRLYTLSMIVKAKKQDKDTLRKQRMIF